jgi:hypothetical protein
MQEAGREIAEGDANLSVSGLSDLAARQGAEMAAVFEKIFAGTQPGAVFSPPVTAGNYTVITASEIASGGAFGSGMGMGQSQGRPSSETAGAGEPAAGRPVQSGGGGGMGGGGGAMSRPVAIITIGPDGVMVRPVYDATKVALASIAAVGTVVAILRGRRR